MNKFIALTACATLALSTPALADTNDFVITNHELAFAFDDVQNLQATAMTDAEMADTQGAVAPIAAYGIRMGVMGTIGAAGNTWNHYNNTGQLSWGAAGRGFALGAIGGGASKYLGSKGW